MTAPKRRTLADDAAPSQPTQNYRVGPAHDSGAALRAGDFFLNKAEQAGPMRRRAETEGFAAAVSATGGAQAPALRRGVPRIGASCSAWTGSGAAVRTVPP